MSEGSNRVYVPRANFEMFFGVKVNPKSLGALLVSGETVLLEYVFMGQAEEVQILENLYSMESKESASL